MRIYYLEEPLSTGDEAFVAEELAAGESIEQVRIPYVLPVLSAGTFSANAHQEHQTLLRRHLRAAGIGRDRNRQVTFVAPREMHWYQVLSFAIEAETGRYPWLVQTHAQREAIGNPGETRIIDMEGMFGRKD